MPSVNDVKFFSVDVRDCESRLASHPRHTKSVGAQFSTGS